MFFSLLTTFLLFSAVFVKIGIIEVQVPFLSNANPPDMQKPVRDFEIKLDVRKNFLEIQTAYTQPPLEEKTMRYDLNSQGLDDMHKKLVELRRANIKSDKIQLFADDDVKYDDLTKVLDQVKFLKDDEPGIDTEGDQKNIDDSQRFLFQKVIMGRVMI